MYLRPRAVLASVYLIHGQVGDTCYYYRGSPRRPFFCLLDDGVSLTQFRPSEWHNLFLQNDLCCMSAQPTGFAHQVTLNQFSQTLFCGRGVVGRLN